MNDPLEEALNQLTPRGAPAELKDRTLASAREALAVPPPRRWDVWCGMAVAAALLLGVGLHLWVMRDHEVRMARLYGPAPLPRHVAETAETIESITDPETGHRIRERWRTACVSRGRSTEKAIEQFRDRYLAIVSQFALTRKEPSHVEKNQVGRDRRGRPGGDTSYRLRRSHLHHQFTA